MYKMCQTEQSAARQKELEQGLLAAMESTRFDELTVSELCQRMEIPRKSFYRYFSGKDGALHALIDHTLLDFERISEGLSDRAKGDPYPGLVRFFSFWNTQKRLLDALQRSNLSGVLVERAVRQAVKEHQVPYYYLPVREQSVRDHAVAFVITGLLSMVLQWHFSGYAQSPQRMAQIAVKILTLPLIPNDIHG